MAQTPCGEPARPASADERDFMVLAGRSGTFYDGSGPAFSMVIRAIGAEVQVDAVGIYADNGRPAFGEVPATTHGSFMQDTGKASDVMLRIQLTRAEYDRALTILRRWDRRAREGALLYPDIAMDNILLVKEVTESLNACGGRFTLYSLDWGVEDQISENNLPTRIPFQYFKELRRLNEHRHLRDGEFPLAAR